MVEFFFSVPKPDLPLRGRHFSDLCHDLSDVVRYWTNDRAWCCGAGRARRIHHFDRKLYRFNWVGLII